MNTEQQVISQDKPKRRNKVAEEKARIRLELQGLANKVPEFVNAGGIQTTRKWVKANDQAVLVAAGGKARMSKRELEKLLARMTGKEVASE